VANIPPDGANMETGDDTCIPRWVKVFLLIAIVLVLAFITLHLTGLAPTGHTP
jgi:hypothetical protein